MITMNVGNENRTARVVVHGVNFIHNRVNLIPTIKAVRILADSMSMHFEPLKGLRDAKIFVEAMIERLSRAHVSCQPLEFEAVSLNQDQLELLLGVCFFQLGVKFDRLSTSQRDMHR